MAGAFFLLIFEPLGATSHIDAAPTPPFRKRQLRLVTSVDTRVRLVHNEP